MQIYRILRDLARAETFSTMIISLVAIIAALGCEPVPPWVPVCGNGHLEMGEECDDNGTLYTDDYLDDLLGGESCRSLGFDGGDLKCNKDCTYREDDCTTIDTCGNGRLDPGEECDDNGTHFRIDPTDDVLGGESCRSLGFDAGDLSCQPDCVFNTGGCFILTPCGNGLLDPGEECDPNGLLLETCVTLGYMSGTLDCYPHGSVNEDCHFDTSGCNAYMDPDAIQAELDDGVALHSEYKLLLPRNGQTLLHDRHWRQYAMACFFHSVGPILEYMGHAHFSPQSHWEREMVYWKKTSHFSTDAEMDVSYSIDVGYFGSVEHVIQQYVDANYGNKRPDDYFPLPTPPDAPASNWDYWYDLYDRVDLATDINGGTDQGFFMNADPVLGINTWGRDCNNRFTAGESYGFCWNTSSSIGLEDPNPDRYDLWLDRIHGSTASTGCVGSCGPLWLLNRYFQGYSMDITPYHNGEILAGCSDASVVDTPTTDGEAVEVMMLVKTFIDHDIPLIASVKEGKHWVMVVGYGQLDEAGVPTAIVLSDSGREQYMIWRGLDDADNWRKYRYAQGSIVNFLVWNQHLNQGCSTGGWARRLDDSSLVTKSLCPPVRSSCQQPTYGIEVRCKNDIGATLAVYSAPIEYPYIEVDRVVQCDSLDVRYYEPGWRVTNAMLHRAYAIDAGDTYEWHYTGSKPDRDLWCFDHGVGDGSVADDGREGYECSWWFDTSVTNPLADETDRRRMWLWLEADDPTTPARRIDVEIVPSKNLLSSSTVIDAEAKKRSLYGIHIDCLDDGSLVDSWSLDRYQSLTRNEIDPMAIREFQFVTEHETVDCDTIRLHANVGNDLQGDPVNVVSASLERQYHDGASWISLDAKSPYAPTISYPDPGGYIFGIQELDINLTAATNIIDWGDYTEDCFLDVTSLKSCGFPEDTTFVRADLTPIRVLIRLIFSDDVERTIMVSPTQDPAFDGY